MPIGHFQESMSEWVANGKSLEERLDEYVLDKAHFRDSSEYRGFQYMIFGANCKTISQIAQDYYLAVFDKARKRGIYFNMTGVADYYRKAIEEA